MADFGNTANDHNWKLYESSRSRIDSLTQSQYEEADKLDKWMMTIAAGSFGLSFAFIDKIVPITQAAHIPFLITAWACFLSILIINFIGFIVSSLGHKILAEEEARILELKYQNIKTEYKKRSVFFDPGIVLGYISILLFIGGSLCLLVFIAKNLL